MATLPPELQKIQDDRESVYGDFTINMTGTSMQMNGLIHQWAGNNPRRNLPGWFAPLFMVAAKLNRIASGNYKQDNFDDAIVYLKQVQVMQKGDDDGH